MMRKFIISILFTLVALTSYSQNYYVSQSEGNDLNTGLSPDQPWKTTTRVNSENIGGGDTVFFKRGDVWKYTDGNYLRLRCGTENKRLVYGAYGIGPKPVISRAFDASEAIYWEDQGNNIWKFKELIPGRDANTGFISFNQDSIIGVKKFHPEDLLEQGDFFTDEVLTSTGTENHTFLYSTANPAEIYRQIDVAIGESGIAGETEGTQISDIVISGIEFYQCGWNGIAIPMGCKNILIEDCTVSFCGGQRQRTSPSPEVRRGQCINTQGNIENFEIRNCIIHNGYDGCIALQGWKEDLVVKDVWIHHNILSRSEYGLEIWGKELSSSVTSVYFENNTCLYHGYGWSHKQRRTITDEKGASVFSWRFMGIAEDIYIRNNIFYMDRAPSFYIRSGVDNVWKSAIHLDYNLYFDGSSSDATEGERAIWFTDYKLPTNSNWNNPEEDPGDLYRADEWEDWIAHSGGFDQHSVVELNPAFMDAFSTESYEADYDLQLMENSPAIGSGMFLERYAEHKDLWGNKPFCKYNIGAFTGSSEPDLEPPVLEVKNISMPLSNSGTGRLSPSDIVVSASDNCMLKDTLLSISEFDCSHIGDPVEVRVTLTDVYGHHVEESATVRIIDTITPTIILPGDTTFYADSNNLYTVEGDLFDPVFTEDNCGFELKNSLNGKSSLDGEVIMAGQQTQVVWTLTDPSGNFASESMYIDLREFDDEDPVLLVRDDTVYLNPMGYCSIRDSEVISFASDNDEIADTVYSQSYFLCSAASSTSEIMVTITDKNLNSTSEKVLVTVLDTIIPTLTLPGDLVVNAGPSNTYEVYGTQLDPLFADDNCGYSLENNITHTNSLNRTTFSPGITDICWTISDHSQNSISKHFQLNVLGISGYRHENSNGLSFYPNPTTGPGVIQNFSETRIDRLLISNIAGNTLEVITDCPANLQLDLSKYPAGIYIITLTTDDSPYQFKVIKK